MHANRQYSLFDKLCIGLDQALRTLTDHAHTSGQLYPATKVTDESMSDAQRKHSAGLMRINHAGEVCAQALYHGQAVASRASDVQEKMEQAALEEGDHLNWCKKRLDELGSHTSYLNPLWYAGSFCIGMAAGMIGDKWSLGFVVETERQVIKHLSGHMNILPTQDQRSYKILERMESDEARHRDEALQAGAQELPGAVKSVMALTSKMMVKTSYYL
jgi:ubiquinone biosynthesis monooxygenase Coq7